MKLLPFFKMFSLNCVEFDQNLGLFCVSENKIKNDTSLFLWGGRVGLKITNVLSFMS